MKKTVIAIIVCAAVLAAGGVILIVLKQSPSGVVLYIDGDPVVIAEFELFLSKYRGAAFSYFNGRYGVEYTAGFWDAEFEGITPASYLKQTARDDLARVKVQQRMAREYGIAGNFSYTRFLADLKKENDARADAFRSGKPIYGPVEYSERDYYEYLFTNLTTALRDFYGRQILDPPDTELREYYDRNREKYRQAGTKTFKHITSANYDSLAEVVRQFESGAAEPSSIIGNGKENLDFTVRELTISASNIKSISIAFPLLFDSAAVIAEGEWGDIFEEAGAFHLLYCTGVTQGEIADYDEIRDGVWSDYVQERYDAHVAELIANAEVKTTPLYDTLKIK